MAKTAPHKRKKKQTTKSKNSKKNKPNLESKQTLASQAEANEIKSERTWVDAMIIFIFVGLALVVAFMVTNKSNDNPIDNQQNPGGSSESAGIGIESGNGLGQLGQSNGSSIQNNTSPMGETSTPDNSSNGTSTNGLQSPIDKCTYQQYEQTPLSPECINQ